jgi:hypothetical protein
MALENSDESLDIKSAWESIRVNINTSAKENLGHHSYRKTGKILFYLS